MQTPRTGPGSILERLENVERENRLLRRGVMALLLGAGSLVWMGYGSIEDQLRGLKAIHISQIETERIVLRDAAGQMRAWLGTADNGTRLLFYDSNGRQRAGFGLGADHEPALACFDAGQNARVVLGMVDGWPGIVLRDSAGRKRTALQTQQNWASLSFYDGAEKRRAAIGTWQDASAVNLQDEEGRERGGLTTDRNGSSLVFFDRGGKKKAGIGLTKDEDPVMGFFRPDGMAEMSLSSFEAQPELKLLGTNRVEALVQIGTNGPQMRLVGPDQTILWKTP